MRCDVPGSHFTRVKCLHVSDATLVAETWPAEVESWLVEVQEEAHLIEALPYVKGTVSFFYSEESTNLNKVHVTVWCCWSAGRLKRVPVHCDEVQRFTHSCCLMSSLRWAPGSQKNA